MVGGPNGFLDRKKSRELAAAVRMVGIGKSSSGGMTHGCETCASDGVLFVVHDNTG